MYSRRQFLAHTVWLAVLPTSMRAFAVQHAPSRAVIDWTPGDLESLAAAMDEIIPAGDGMPSASMAGGAQYLHYLAWQYPEIGEEIARFLKLVGQASIATFRDDLRKLRPDQRVQVLQAVEKTQATTFSSFLAYTYEAYYTNPRVLGSISCLPQPASMEDDGLLLAPVRKLMHLHREAP